MNDLPHSLEYVAKQFFITTLPSPWKVRAAELLSKRAKMASIGVDYDTELAEVQLEARVYASETADVALALELMSKMTGPTRALESGPVRPRALPEIARDPVFEALSRSSEASQLHRLAEGDAIFVEARKTDWIMPPLKELWRALIFEDMQMKMLAALRIPQEYLYPKRGW